MSESKSVQNKEVAKRQATSLPDYIPPRIETYTSEEIFERIGPAMACSSPCAVTP